MDASFGTVDGIVSLNHGGEAGRGARAASGGRDNPRVLQFKRSSTALRGVASPENIVDRMALRRSVTFRERAVSPEVVHESVLTALSRSGEQIDMAARVLRARFVANQLMHLSGQ